ncbi:hypothetical protein ABZ912_42510 [Nonomuraea angiospora]|uniref:hypothetical protein n=1 Tax=Nonomuraea angiospora TaxID=46172 RepID=UPI0033F913B2
MTWLSDLKADARTSRAPEAATPGCAPWCREHDREHGVCYAPSVSDVSLCYAPGEGMRITSALYDGLESLSVDEAARLGRALLSQVRLTGLV